jgi:DNA-binding transcriptional ArsR family regulator
MATSEPTVSGEAADDGEQTYAGTPEERLERNPLLMSIGDCSASRVVLALLNHHPYPLTPSGIAEAAGIDRSTWYDVRDPLLEVGMVVERGEQGNSPLYGLADDDRADALETIAAIGGAELRPDPPA